MRKTLMIIVVGSIIALFPLLALPPHIESGILLFLGVSIIFFGLYEKAIEREKQQSLSYSKKTLSGDDTVNDPQIYHHIDDIQDSEI